MDSGDVLKIELSRFAGGEYGIGEREEHQDELRICLNSSRRAAIDRERRANEGHRLGWMGLERESRISNHFKRTQFSSWVKQLNIANN